MHIIFSLLKRCYIASSIHSPVHTSTLSGSDTGKKGTLPSPCACAHHHRDSDKPYTSSTQRNPLSPSPAQLLTRFAPRIEPTILQKFSACLICLEQIRSPSFHNTCFSSLQCLHTFLVTNPILESPLSFPFSCSVGLCAIVSPFSFLYYIHSYISTYH